MAPDADAIAVGASEAADDAHGDAAVELQPTTTLVNAKMAVPRILGRMVMTSLRMAVGVVHVPTPGHTSARWARFRRPRSAGYPVTSALVRAGAMPSDDRDRTVSRA